MDETIKIIKKEFYSSFEGSKLNSIAYVSDDMCGVDELMCLNHLEEANDAKEHFTECILFSSDFRSPKNGGCCFDVD